MRADLQRLNRDAELTELRLAGTSASSTATVPRVRSKANGCHDYNCYPGGDCGGWNCLVAILFVKAFRSARADATQRHRESTRKSSVCGGHFPDGRYLAYADFTGVSVRLLETGETHSLLLRKVFASGEQAFHGSGTEPN